MWGVTNQIPITTPKHQERYLMKLFRAKRCQKFKYDKLLLESRIQYEPELTSKTLEDSPSYFEYANDKVGTNLFLGCLNKEYQTL